MTATTKVPLGATTLNRKWYLDVDVSAAPHTVPNWIGVFGSTEFKPGLSDTLQDDSDFDSEGYKSQTKTATQWTLETKVSRKVTAASAVVYDPGQEALRLAANEMGVDNTVHVRWYEMEPGGPRVEAYDGSAAVSWSPDGGSMEALDTVSVKLTGQGKRTAITHPGTFEAVPVISSLAPSTAGTAGGNLIIITGTGFATATSVTVNAVAVAAADWEMVSATKIAFKAPANTAGAKNVIVINGGGSSVASPLTYA